MSLKDEVKNFGRAILTVSRVILSISIGIVLTVAFVVSLSTIPIVSIVNLILEFLITFPSKKKFTESNSLKKELRKLRDYSLPGYDLLYSSNQQNSDQTVPKITDNQKRQISKFRETGEPSYVRGLIKNNQEKDQITRKFLYGYHKLNNDVSAKFFELAGFKAGSIFPNTTDIVRWITIIFRIFLFLFLKALGVIGFRIHEFLRFVKDECKKEILEEFRSLKSKVSMLLLSNRSAMEKEAACLLFPIIYTHITSFDRTLEFKDFAKCRDMVVEMDDDDNYNEINEKIVEKLASIFVLLASVKLDLETQLSKKEFEKRFNTQVYNLMRCISTSGILRIFGSESEYSKRRITTFPKLSDKEVKDLRTEFSNFLDSFLKNNALNYLSKAEKEYYIKMCCTKLLKAYIDYGSIYGGHCCLPDFPSENNIYANNISNYLSNDIAKSLNLRELANIIENGTGNSGYDIPRLLRLLLPRESLMTGLANPMKNIINIIERHMGKDVGEYSAVDMPLPDAAFIDHHQQNTLLSTALSQDDFSSHKLPR